MSHFASTVSVGPVGPEDADDVVALFERSGATDFSQFDRFDGDATQWRLRCSKEPEKNRQALLLELSEGKVIAFVARADRCVVGWMRMERVENLPKLFHAAADQGLSWLDGDRTGFFFVEEFLVDPRERRAGVARALLSSGVAWARGQGASALEAFPCRAQDGADEEQFRGPLRLYQAFQFQQIHDDVDHPVMRLSF